MLIWNFCTLIGHVGTSLLAEYEFTAASLTLPRRYVYGPATDEPLFGEGVIVLQGLALLTLPLAGLALFLRRRARRKAIK